MSRVRQLVTSIRNSTRQRRASGTTTHEDANRVFHSCWPGWRDRVGAAPET